MFKIARREESSRESIGEDLKSSESKTRKKRKKLKIKNKKWRRWRSARRGSAEKKTGHAWKTYGHACNIR